MLELVEKFILFHGLTIVVFIFKPFFGTYTAIESFYIQFLTFITCGCGYADDNNTPFDICKFGKVTWPLYVSWYFAAEIFKFFDYPDTPPLLINPIATLTAFLLNDITLIEFVIKISIQIGFTLFGLMSVLILMTSYDENSENLFLTSISMENINFACDAEFIMENIAKNFYKEFCAGFGLAYMYCYLINEVGLTSSTTGITVKKFIGRMVFSLSIFILKCNILQYYNPENFNGNAKTFYPCEIILNLLANVIGILMTVGLYKRGNHIINFLIILVLSYFL